MTIDVLRIYEDIAAWFDDTRTRSLMEKPYLDAALSLAPENPAVLDLGCGTAEPIAAYLIAHGAQVTGVDGAQAMIDMCRARFPAHAWITGDMRGLALGTQFDIIIAWHSFFHLTADEQRAMFAVFAAHLRNGGVLMFTSGSRAGVAWGDMQGHRVHHDSLAPEEYRALGAAHGFKVVQHSEDDPACGNATVWIMQKGSVSP